MISCGRWTPRSPNSGQFSYPLPNMVLPLWWRVVCGSELEWQGSLHDPCTIPRHMNLPPYVYGVLVDYLTVLKKNTHTHKAIYQHINIQSEYEKVRWLVKTMLEICFILFPQYNILFPQERYFVPTTYYVIRTRSVFCFHNILFCSHHILSIYYLSVIYQRFMTWDRHTHLWLG